MARPVPTVLLASLLAGPSTAQAPPVKAQDARQVQTYLDKAKQEFETEMKRYRQEVNKLLDQEREAVAKKETDSKKFTEVVNRIRQQKADFVEKGTVPDSLKEKLKSVKNLILPAEAGPKLEKAYVDAIAGYGRLKMDKKADALKEEFERRKKNGELLGLEVGWEPLFNGKDLTGWEKWGKAEWQVKDEVLIGSGEHGLLITKRADYSNYKLRLEAKVEEGGNSGVFFRIADRKQPITGTHYEAQIECNPKGQGDTKKTGTLMSKEGGKVSKVHVHIDTPVHKPNDWFPMEVTVEGTRITVSVDSKVVSEFDDKDKQYPLNKGPIAIQQYTPGHTVSFRKVEILELPLKK